MDELKEQTAIYLTNEGLPVLWDQRKSFSQNILDGHGQMSFQPVRGNRLRTKYSTSDPVYNHCLAVFMENFADYDNPRQESISETVIVIFGILFMGMCSKKKTL